MTYYVISKSSLVKRRLLPPTSLIAELARNGDTDIARAPEVSLLTMPNPTTTIDVNAENIARNPRASTRSVIGLNHRMIIRTMRPRSVRMSLKKRQKSNMMLDWNEKRRNGSRRNGDASWRE